MITYATYAEFTQVYSLKGVTQADVESTWLPHGALRVNEELGSCFTTPFSSNNQTAKDLSIHFGYLGVLMRTRNQTDSEELLNYINSRIDGIKNNNAPMVTTSGDSFFADGDSVYSAWSTTQTYKPVFDFRDAECQRVDPDLLDELNTQDS